MPCIASESVLEAISEFVLQIEIGFYVKHNTGLNELKRPP